MSKILMVLLLILILSACATSKTIYGPNGQEAHSINCSGMVLSLADCWEKAGDICKNKGYDIIGAMTNNGQMITVNAAGIQSMDASNRVIVIQCRP